MSASDVLQPDGFDYDIFLQAEVGEDRTGAAVTVLSAFARLGLEPWTEAKELARLRSEDAEVRLKAHLAAITDVPALALASGSKAAKLISLLPKQAPRISAKASRTVSDGFPNIPLFWVAFALIGVAVTAWIYYLAQMG